MFRTHHQSALVKCQRSVHKATVAKTPASRRLMPRFHWSPFCTCLHWNQPSTDWRPAWKRRRRRSLVFPFWDWMSPEDGPAYPKKRPLQPRASSRMRRRMEIGKSSTGPDDIIMAATGFANCRKIGGPRQTTTAKD